MRVSELWVNGKLMSRKYKSVVAFTIQYNNFKASIIYILC